MQTAPHSYLSIVRLSRVGSSALRRWWRPHLVVAALEMGALIARGSHDALRGWATCSECGFI